MPQNRYKTTYVSHAFLATTETMINRDCAIVTECYWTPSNEYEGPGSLMQHVSATDCSSGVYCLHRFHKAAGSWQCVYMKYVP